MLVQVGTGTEDLELVDAGLVVVTRVVVADGVQV
jgi:hypothetical protein